MAQEPHFSARVKLEQHRMSSYRDLLVWKPSPSSHMAHFYRKGSSVDRKVLSPTGSSRGVSPSSTRVQSCFATSSPSPGGPRLPPLDMACVRGAEGDPKRRTVFFRPRLPPRRHQNRKGEGAQTMSHVQVDPPSLGVCPSGHAGVRSPGEQLSASRPCGGRQRKAEEGSIACCCPTAPRQHLGKACPWSLLPGKPRDIISTPLRFAEPWGGGV